MENGSNYLQYGLGTCSIPLNAQLIGDTDCTYNCEFGYGGQDCAACSAFLPDDANWVLNTCDWTCDHPDNSELIDSSVDCSYNCELGYEKSGDQCLQCGTLPTDAEWEQNTCDWTCSNPDHSVLLNSSVDCSYECDDGYENIDSECQICVSTLPDDASWIVNTCNWECSNPDNSELKNPSVDCTYDCEEGYLSTGTDCELCSPTLPTDATWTVNTCDWTCDPPDNSVLITPTEDCTYNCLDGFLKTEDDCEACSVSLPTDGTWITNTCT